MILFGFSTSNQPWRRISHDRREKTKIVSLTRPPITHFPRQSTLSYIHLETETQSRSGRILIEFDSRKRKREREKQKTLHFPQCHNANPWRRRVGQLGRNEGIPRFDRVTGRGKFASSRANIRRFDVPLSLTLETRGRDRRGVLTEGAGSGGPSVHRGREDEISSLEGGGTFPRVNAIKRWSSSGGAICPEQQAEKLSLCTSGIISRG